MVEATEDASWREVVPSLTGVARGVLLLRLAAAAASVPMLASSPDGAVVAFVLLLLVLVVSLYPLLRWQQVAEPLMRQPRWLALDLVVAVLFLSAAGVAAPFVLATVATAFLGGLLFAVPGAVVTASVLGVSYLLVAVGSGGGAGDTVVPGVVLTNAALYPALGVAGAGLRNLLVELAELGRARRVAQAHAAQLDARLAFARDLHDAVGKSLFGVSLTAEPLRSHPDPDVRVVAERVVAASGAAADEARQLMRQLRGVTTSAPAHDEVHVDRLVQAGLEVEVDLARVRSVIDGLPAGQPSTVRTVLDELLENVLRHADAGRVRIEAQEDTAAATIRVLDDGRGIAAGRLEQARDDGRFGIVGVRERMAGIGGSVRWCEAPSGGTCVELVVPRHATVPGGRT